MADSLKNYCPTDLTLYFSAPNVKPANETFPSGLAYVQAISGAGNSLAVLNGDHGPNGICKGSRTPDAL